MKYASPTDFIRPVQYRKKLLYSVKIKSANDVKYIINEDIITEALVYSKDRRTAKILVKELRKLIYKYREVALTYEEDNKVFNQKSFESNNIIVKELNDGYDTLFRPANNESIVSQGKFSAALTYCRAFYNELIMTNLLSSDKVYDLAIKDTKEKFGIDISSMYNKERFLTGKTVITNKLDSTNINKDNICTTKI